MSPDSCDVVIIGGGFYGLRLAAMTAAAGRTTTLLERSDRFLSRASYVNQARVHGGYHYPRSVLTALRARAHYARFSREFAGAIHGDVQHLYAIARHQTKVGAREFAEFCRRIGAPLSPVARAIGDKFDPAHIEAAFVVEEAVFDAHRLADQAIAEALRAGVRCRAATEVVAVEPGVGRRLRVHWQRGSDSGAIGADLVVNATYAALNDVLTRSGLETSPLIHELTEVAIVRPPDGLRGMGVTVMDGPFWSSIPFPTLSAYSLTHVRYTPHFRWRSDDADAGDSARRASEPRQSHAPLMQRDAQRFMPMMRDARYLASLWETKTILPRSAGDDSRPMLARRHDDAPGLVSVLGAKIDSVYDVEDEVRELLPAV